MKEDTKDNITLIVGIIGIIFALMLLFMSCMGQYPVSKINSKGEIYNANVYTQTQFDSARHLLTEGDGGPRPVRVTTSPFLYTDSVKYYWLKEIYFERLMNKELDRLNRTGHANDISKSLLRYQDSAIKYKILLDKCTAQ